MKTHRWQIALEKDDCVTGHQGITNSNDNKLPLTLTLPAKIAL